MRYSGRQQPLCPFSVKQRAPIFIRRQPAFVAPGLLPERRRDADVWAEHDRGCDSLGEDERGRRLLPDGASEECHILPVAPPSAAAASLPYLREGDAME